MRKTALFLVVLALALPLSAATWKNVNLMDAGCAHKKATMDNPDNHPRSCAMQCAKAGYGAIVDGKFVKFDEKGSAMAKEALQKSAKKDHLRATVNGEMKDGMITVSSLTLD